MVEDVVLHFGIAPFLPHRSRCCHPFGWDFHDSRILQVEALWITSPESQVNHLSCICRLLHSDALLERCERWQLTPFDHAARIEVDGSVVGHTPEFGGKPHGLRQNPPAC